MTRVAVTGGLGRIGRAVQEELNAHGYHTLCIDLAPPRKAGGLDYRRADLREFWQTLDALDGTEMVVHLAAVGMPESHTTHPLLADQHIFATNILSMYNVFWAIAARGLRRVVWASSETVLGAPYRVGQPKYVPLDDQHLMQPETSYAVSKAIGEELAEHVVRQVGLTVIGLRFSVIMDDEDYVTLPDRWADPTRGRWNLWSYTDLRDAATSCRLALEADLSGARAFMVTAADTVMDRQTAELLRDFLPDIRQNSSIEGHQSLQSSAGAGNMLGYRPRYSWRERRSTLS
jgi:nucleoside-diphosphate-sugar epimerase